MQALVLRLFYRVLILSLGWAVLGLTAQDILLGGQTSPPSKLASTDPNADQEPDGLTNAEEAEHHTNPNNANSDGDGKNDSLDGVPLDPYFETAPAPEARYAVIEIPVPPNLSGQIIDRSVSSINGSNQVLVRVSRVNDSDAAYIWSPSDPTHFAILPSGFIQLSSNTNSYGFADDGTVIGNTSNWEAAFWSESGGGPTLFPWLELTGLPSQHDPESRVAIAASSNGKVVGSVSGYYFEEDVEQGYDPTLVSYDCGVLWSNGGASQIAEPRVLTYYPNPPHDYDNDENTLTIPELVNNHGYVIGSGSEGRRLWNGQNLIDLPAPIQNLEKSFFSMNDLNPPVVTGSIENASTLWTYFNGQWRWRAYRPDYKPALGLGDALLGWMLGNDRQEAIGVFRQPQTYEDLGDFRRNGKIHFLNDLISGWHVYPAAINKNGWIVAAGIKLNVQGEPTGNYMPVMLMPYEIDIKAQGANKEKRDGLIVEKNDVVEIQLTDIPQGSFPVAATSIVWYSRKLKWDGTYEAWQDMGISARGVKFNHTCNDPGIFQVKCEWSIGAQQFTAYFDRDCDDPYTREVWKLEKGDLDSFGVVDEEWQIELRDAAKDDLGSSAYAMKNNVPPVGPGLPKCNIFVANCGVQSNVYIPWFNGTLIPFPPVANQWAGVPPIPPGNPAYENHFVDWTLLPASTYPQPGFVAAKGFYTWASGHCGIVDYDGRWISASTETDTVNRQASFENQRGQDLNGFPILPRMRKTTE